MIYWPQRHWGGVRARYCASVHSCAVKWSRKTKGKTSRHQASFKMGVIVSSCSWSWFKVLTSMYVARTCFTRTFPQLRSPPSPCQPCDKWYTSQKQREDISDLPFPLPPPESPRLDRFKATPHPRAQMAGLVPKVARGIVTGLTNWTVHQWQFSLITSPFALASLRCLPP